uniref:Uncharacterized protein n=1 Tax=Cucumis sativus TaxID=3659 RepID=A0A0A0KP20_CUCSA
MDLKVKSTKMKRERDTLQRNEGGVSMDLKTELHGGQENWNRGNGDIVERERKRGKFGEIGEMGLRQMGGGSSFEDDRRQFGSDKRRREMRGIRERERERERFEAEEEVNA